MPLLNREFGVLEYRNLTDLDVIKLAGDGIVCNSSEVAFIEAEYLGSHENFVKDIKKSKSFNTLLKELGSSKRVLFFFEAKVSE